MAFADSRQPEAPSPDAGAGAASSEPPAPVSEPDTAVFDALWPGLVRFLWTRSLALLALGLMVMALTRAWSGTRAGGLALGLATGLGLLALLGREVRRLVLPRSRGCHPRGTAYLVLLKYPVLAILLYPFFAYELVEPIFFLGGFSVVQAVFLYKAVDSARDVAHIHHLAKSPREAPGANVQR
ncbi:MAG: hypothetical protein HY814_11785 [Candidatus Riflebacteria bacterium]|nr:hypothetical protein [Candidatus Riflebacteria bacterium]